MSTNGGSYADMPEIRMMTFRIIGVEKPKGVTLSDGTNLDEEMSVMAIRQYGWAYDEASRSLYVRLPWDYSKQAITIKD